MSNLTDRVSYLKGLAEGMQLDKDTSSNKLLLSMLDVLLKDGAKRAAEIKEEFVPTFPSIEAFFQAIDRWDMDKDAVIYNEDGSVTLDYKK